MLDGLDEVKRGIVDLEGHHVTFLPPSCIWKPCPQLLKKEALYEGTGVTWTAGVICWLDMLALNVDWTQSWGHWESASPSGFAVSLRLTSLLIRLNTSTTWKGIFAMDFVQKRECSPVKGSTHECHLGLAALVGDSSFAPLRPLALAP